MNWLKLGILAIVAMATILVSPVGAGDLCAFEVYYTPLEMEFYVPPTPEDLEESGDKINIYVELIRLIVNLLVIRCNIVFIK